MRLIIVRHGQTDANVKDILVGQHGPGLNKKGQEQARKIAQRLKKEKIDLVYSSDQLRTRETSQIILKYHPKVKLHLVPQLRDRNFGKFNNRKEEELLKAIKENHTNWEDCCDECGETFKEVQMRVVGFYKRVVEKNEGKTVLLVFHGDPIASLVVYLLGKSIYEERKYSPRNGAITIFNIEGNKCKIELLESVSHLKS